MIYGHTSLIVFMYTVRTILINTENKTNKKQTKQEEEEQKQHQNTLPHLKREIKRVRESGASGEMGMLVGVLLC